MQRKRNVLFIIIDQLRADCVSGALAAHVALPNLRAFAAGAVSFARHFSVTNPCGPSRASILTGQYAMNHRSVRNGTPLRHDTPNIATEMRKAGYLPMLFGYTDTSQDPRVHHPNDPALKSYEFPMPGFHEMTEMRFELSYPWQSHLKKRGYEFDRYEDVYRPVSPDGGAPRLNDPALYSAKDSDTAFLTDCFLDQIAAYKNEPWFAHLTYIRPHPPFVAPAPYNAMYDPAALPLPKRLAAPADETGLHPFIAPALQHAQARKYVQGFPDLDPTDTNVQAMRAVYLGLATEVDHHVGRVLGFLKDSGQEEDTMVVITADHGEMLGDHHLWGKMNFFDASYHTPLMIRVPGLGTAAGTVVQQPTESIDVTPTILDWIGQDIPNAMDGRSLMPFLRGEAPEGWRTYTYSELDFGEPGAPTIWQEQLGIGVSAACLAILRSEQFTLVEFAADLPSVLFDHRRRGEMENVADRAEYATDLARLSRLMLRHRMVNADHTLSLDAVTKDGVMRQTRHA